MPPGCDITYNCIGVSAPFTTDWPIKCDISGVTTFDGVEDGDSNDLTWTFQSLDLQRYKMGTYTVLFEGVTGINSFQTVTASFDLTLDNPCLGASLTLIEPQPMLNMNNRVRDPTKL